MSELRHCTVCDTDKPLTEFYHRAPPRQDKFFSHCKPCFNAKVLARQKTPKGKERTRLASLKYSRSAYGKQHQREYQQSERGHSTVVKANANHRLRHPDRAAARLAVREATRSGKLVRQPCEVCGADKSHGHHDDYSRPLDVRWLCVTHHVEHHNKMKEELHD